MYLFSYLKFSKVNFFSLLLALIPVSFIAGNMIININILLIIFSVLIFFGRDLFSVKLFILDKIIIFFFFFILGTGVLNDISLYLEHKSLQLTWVSIWFHMTGIRKLELQCLPLFVKGIFVPY